MCWQTHIDTHLILTEVEGREGGTVLRAGMLGKQVLEVGQHMGPRSHLLRRVLDPWNGVHVHPEVCMCVCVCLQSCCSNYTIFEQNYAKTRERVFGWSNIKQVHLPHSNLVKVCLPALRLKTSWINNIILNLKSYFCALLVMLILEEALISLSRD